MKARYNFTIKETAEGFPYKETMDHLEKALTRRNIKANDMDKLRDTISTMHIYEKPFDRNQHYFNGTAANGISIWGIIYKTDKGYRFLINA